MPRRHARPHDRRFRRRYLVLAGSVAVLLLAVIAVRLATGGPTLAQTDAAARAGGTSCAAGAACAAPSGATPSATSAAPRTSPSRPAAARTHRTRRPAGTPTAAPSPQPAPQPAPSAASAAGAVLAVINQARAGAGLPAYTVTSGLRLSSSRHNQLMASGCGLSHQCPGEPSLGDRETAAGVHWTAAGENIGEGGPVSDSTAAITQMAVALTQDMLAEKPPDDGHRLNILSSAFTHVGITVQRSADGTVWMTQDFSN